MALEKINFSYPKGSLQSVFDGDAVTALELAALNSKKVDECVDIVNGVEQTAIEATAIVDDMQLQQQQFLTDNADTRAQLVTDNQLYLDGLTAAKTQYETDLSVSKAAFETNINNEVAGIVAGADATILTNVNTKVDALIADGTIDNLINVDTQKSIAEATGSGVVSGLNVLAQASPNMTVLVSPGTAHLFDGKRYNLESNAIINIDAADASFPRIDIIYINSLGVLTYGKGEAKVAPVALQPLNSIILAEISVNIGQLTITTDKITDKRFIKTNFLKIEEKINDLVYNIKNYGAKCDGITDDSAAINSLLLTLSNASGGTIKLPRGTIIAKINYPLNGKVINIVGDGITSTIIKPPTKDTPVFKGITGSTNVVNGASIKGFSVMAHDEGSTGEAFNVTGFRSAKFSEIGYYSNNGFKYKYLFNIVAQPYLCYGCSFERIIIDGQLLPDKVFNFTNNGFGTAYNANRSKISDCWFNENTGSSVIIDALESTDTVIENNLFENNPAAKVIRSGNQTKVRENWFELNLDDIVYEIGDNMPNNGLVMGNYFSNPHIINIPGDVQGNLWLQNEEPGGKIKFTGNNWNNVKLDGKNLSLQAKYPTFINNWTNIGGESSPVRFWIDHLDQVHIDGTITGGVVPSVAFVLPEGYRPLTNKKFPIVSNGALGVVHITYSGNVTIEVGDTSHVSLEGICYQVRY